MGRFETIEHTADVGVRVWAESLEDLFISAALALTAIMTDPAKVADTVTVPIEAEAADLPGLLVAWLNEIIYLTEVKGMLFHSYEITSLAPTRLSGTAVGETIDPAKHELKTEVKACTYHGLKIGKEKAEWTGQVIFDI